MCGPGDHCFCLTSDFHPESSGLTPPFLLIAKTGTHTWTRCRGRRRETGPCRQELARELLKIGDVEGNPSPPIWATGQSDWELSQSARPRHHTQRPQPEGPEGLRNAGPEHNATCGVLPVRGPGGRGPRACQPCHTNFSNSCPGASQVQAKLDASHAWEVQATSSAACSGQPGTGRRGAAAYERSLKLLPELPASDALWAKATRGRAVLIATLGDMQERDRNTAGALAQYQDRLSDRRGNCQVPMATAGNPASCFPRCSTRRLRSGKSRGSEGGAAELSPRPRDRRGRPSRPIRPTPGRAILSSSPRRTWATCTGTSCATSPKH